MEQYAITALCGLRFYHLMNAEKAARDFNTSHAWPAELARHKCEDRKAEEPRRPLSEQQHERDEPDQYCFEHDLGCHRQPNIVTQVCNDYRQCDENRRTRIAQEPMPIMEGSRNDKQ